MKRLLTIGIVLLGLAIAISLGGCPRQQSARPPAGGGPATSPAVELPAPEPAQEVNCSVCRRPCDPNRLIQAETAEGILTFCCPVCLASYVADGKIDPETDPITLHDYITEEPVSLAEAVIIVDSDVICPAGRSAVVMGSEENANKFIAEHGGTKLAWQDFLTEQSQR